MSLFWKIGKTAAATGGGILGVALFIGLLLFQLFLYGGFVVLSVYIFLHVIDHFRHPSHSNTSYSQQQIYNATQDNFKIKFPGTPTISEIAPSAKNGTTGGRSYDLQIENSGEEYTVALTNFTGDLSGLSPSQINEGLQQDLNSSAQSGGFSIKSSQFINFDGYTAIEAKLSSSSFNDVNEISFYRGNSEIVILTSGVADGKFEAFASSFQNTE